MKSKDPCPACGVWICNKCGHKRQYASREGDQACFRCGSEVGHFKDMFHQQGRHDDHAQEMNWRGR